MKYHKDYRPKRTEWQSIVDPFDRNWGEFNRLYLDDLATIANEIGASPKDIGGYRLQETIGDKEIVMHLDLSRMYSGDDYALWIETSVYVGEPYLVQYGGGYGSSGVLARDKRMHGSCGSIRTTDINAPKLILAALRNKLITEKA